MTTFAVSRPSRPLVAPVYVPTHPAILRYMAQHIDEYTFPPTVAQIAAALSIKQTTVWRHMFKMREHGYLWQPDPTRTVYTLSEYGWLYVQRVTA